MNLPGTQERLEAGPTTTIVKVPGSQTGGRLSAVEMHLDGGWKGPPLHVHAVVEHTWYVLDGAVTLTVGDETTSFSRGDCLHVPAGTAHGFSTADTDGAVVLEVDSPKALDGYFRDLAASLVPGQPPDPADVGEIMHRHDTTPVGLG